MVDVAFMVKTCPKMLKLLNIKFMPSDYQQRLFKEYQNLKQKELSISALTEEFLKLQIRTGLQEDEEDDEHAAARYVNGLRYQLQDELALLKVNSVDEAYQLALKAEEKLNRRGKAAIKRGSNSLNRGRGNYPRSTSEADSSMEQKPDFQSRGSFGHFEPCKFSTDCTTQMLIDTLYL